MNRAWMIGLTLLVLAFAPTATVAQTPLLDQRIPEVAFTDAPLEQVLAWLADIAGANVVTRWQNLEDRGVERDKPVTLKLRNVRLSNALLMILAEAGGSDTKLGYRVDENTLTITTADDVNSDMLVVVYDVRDLLSTVRHFPGPQVDFQQAQPGQGGGVIRETGNAEEPPRGDGSANQTQLERLIDVIRSTIEPDTWDGNGGTGTIEPFGGQLVVRNTVVVHQKLGGPVRGTFVAVVR